MGSTFLSTPAKRPISYSLATMSDPNPNASNGPSKRSKQPQPPIHVPPGHVAFRLLCHASRIGGVIGKSGNIIKQLQQTTGAKIRIEDSPPESPDRVVTVIAPSAVTTAISLSVKTNSSDRNGDASCEFDVSKAQEALIRVFERILQVAAESDGAGVGVGIVSCRVLAEKNQAGSVIGKGGKVIEQIRKESGCKIRILKDKLPACAEAGEEMIEIEGDVLGVKKALIATSRRLQDCPPADKGRTGGNRIVEAVPQQIVSDIHVDLPQRNPVLPVRTNSSISHASGVDSLSFEIDPVTNFETKTFKQEVTFKILCPVDRVGGVIGKGGTIVRALQNETGAAISVGSTLSGCDERLITITASESLETRFSPAQKGVVLVFARSIDVGNEKGQDSGSQQNSVTARLLVHSNQVGCLLGKGGAIVSEIRRLTGAGIRMMAGDQLPKCASENEEVVQISGDFLSVQDALYNVTGRLRDHIFSSASNSMGSRSSSSLLAETSPYGRPKETAPLRLNSLSTPPSYSRYSNIRPATDHLGLSQNLENSLSPSLWESTAVSGAPHRSNTDIGRGIASLRSGFEMGSGSKSAIVTNTTVEIAVPEDVIHCVYGENGSHLARLRQISGAKVIVHEPLPGKSDRRVVISGTPDETQAAQSLLHAFILTGS